MSASLSIIPFLVLSWLFLFGFFCGIGLCIRRAFGLKLDNADDVLACFWIGWVYALFYLQLWHIFLPIDWRSLVCLLLSAITGILLNRKELYSLSIHNPSFTIICVLVMLFISLYLACRAIFTYYINFDTGLYHLSTIRWLKTFPIVPGLANLHGRLAFNSTYFQYIAMLEVGPWIEKTRFIANGVLIFSLLTQIIIGAIQCLNYKRNFPLQKLLLVFLLLPFIPFMQVSSFHDNFSNYSSDLAVFILQIILSAQLLVFIKNPPSSNSEQRYALFYVLSILCLGISIRINFIIFGLAYFFTIVVAIYLNKEGFPWKLKYSFYITLAVLLLTLAPWVVRSVISSGYIAYPIALGAVPVEWRAPHHQLIDEVNLIAAWAKNPDPQFWINALNGWGWLYPWLIRMVKRSDVIVPMSLMLMGFIILVIRFCLGRISKANEFQVFLFMLPSITVIPFWFFSAPEIRFAGSSFWIIGAGISLISLVGMKEPCVTSLLRAIFCLLLILMCLSLVEGKGAFAKEIVHKRDFFDAFKLLQFAGSKLINYNDFFYTPRTDVKQYVTNSGLVLNVPVEGVQCWDADLPCTPYPDSKLQLRKNNSLRYGFMVQK